MPEGELLPAEERLQNVLKAIVDRMLEEQAMLREIPEDDPDYEAMILQKRNFIQGLDIAWSLAQTEILRRTDSPRTS